MENKDDNTNDSLKNPMVDALEEWLEKNEPRLDLTIGELNNTDTDDN
jgi:hypothetical protein